MKAKEETQEMTWFRKNFKLIRQAVGWSTAEFAENVGASPQTINNLESKKDCRLTKILYYAIRFRLDNEIRTREKETRLLKLVLDAFVDRREKYTDEQREEIREQTDTFSPSLKDKKEQRNKIVAIILTTLGTALVAIASTAIAGSWMKKVR